MKKEAYPENIAINGFEGSSESESSESEEPYETNIPEQKEKLKENEKQFLLNRSKINELTQRKYRMDAILRDVERTKNPETQLKNIRNKMRELENIQEQQQTQVLIEMNKGTKVSNAPSFPCNNRIMIQTSTNNESRNNVISLDHEVDAPVNTLCQLNVKDNYPNHAVKHTVNFQVDLAFEFQPHSQVTCIPNIEILSTSVKNLNLLEPKSQCTISMATNQISTIVNGECEEDRNNSVISQPSQSNKIKNDIIGELAISQPLKAMT